MAVLSFSHFMVDLACAYLVAGMYQSDLAVALVVYNFCAFALQMPLGIIVENHFSSYKTASLGIGLVVVAWFFSNYTFVALIIAGVGNALFHLGGGLSVMNKSGKASPLGIFIAPGALGLYLGAFLPLSWWIPIILILCTLSIVLWLNKDSKSTITPNIIKFDGKYLAVVSLFMVVVLRGFLGVISTFEWKPQLSLAFVAAVVLGKAIGGILSDRFGAGKVGFASLIVSAVCFLFPQNPITGLVGVFAFQATMPITLWAITKIVSKGFGFGLLTFALFLGSIPTFLGVSLTLPLPLLSIISLMLLYIGLKKGVLQ